jgi:hypothetical protein
MASITSNKGTCEPVPRNLVMGNKIKSGCQLDMACAEFSRLADGDWDTKWLRGGQSEADLPWTYADS